MRNRQAAAAQQQGICYGPSESQCWGGVVVLLLLSFSAQSMALCSGLSAGAGFAQVVNNKIADIDLTYLIYLYQFFITIFICDGFDVTIFF